MNSDEIFGVVDKIAATASKNMKIDMLKEGCRSPDFVKVLFHTYNPLITYGVDKMPERTTYGAGHFNEATWQIVSDLASRKLTGNEARDVIQVEVDRLSEPSSQLFKRILRKDLRAGFSESSCNKVVKGLIPEFPYQRCSLPKNAKLDEWDWAKGHVSQEKADGMFANVNHAANGEVSILSRQGSQFPLTHLSDLVLEVKTRLIAGTQSHGELLVMKDGLLMPRALSNGVMNSVLSGNPLGEGEVVIFKVWDSIPLEEVRPKGRYKLPYVNRIRDLTVALGLNSGSLISLIDSRVVYSLAEAYRHAGALMKQGKEGTIVKNRNAEWVDGTSKHQVKLKLEFEVDLKIVGIVDGREASKNEGRAGSFACVTSDGLLTVDVTVKNEAMRDDVDENPEKWISKIIAVIANELIEPSESNDSYSLFLPRMAETSYRADKNEADSLEQAIAIKEAAILGVALKEAA